MCLSRLWLHGVLYLSCKLLYLSYKLCPSFVVDRNYPPCCSVLALVDSRMHNVSQSKRSSGPDVTFCSVLALVLPHPQRISLDSRLQFYTMVLSACTCGFPHLQRITIQTLLRTWMWLENWNEKDSITEKCQTKQENRTGGGRAIPPMCRLNLYWNAHNSRLLRTAKTTWPVKAKQKKYL